MSAFISFSESRDVKIPEWTGHMRSGVIALLVGMGLLYVSLFVFIPSDTYSTARWFDSLGVNQAIAGQVTWFAFLNPTLVSEEGFWFSVFVSVANLALAYQAAFGGYWFLDDKDSNLFSVIKAIMRGTADVKKINGIKVSYFLILVSLTVFETLTGMEFRQSDESLIGAVKAAAVAFVVENAGSDWALTAGAGMTLSGFLQVWNAYNAGRSDIAKLRSSMRGSSGGGNGGNQSGGGGQQKPRDDRRNDGGGGGGRQPVKPHGMGGQRQQSPQQQQRPPVPDFPEMRQYRSGNVAPPHASSQPSRPPTSPRRQSVIASGSDTAGAPQPTGWPDSLYTRTRGGIDG